MIGLMQRVTSARVEVGGETVARIGPGLLVLIGVERKDGEAQAARLVQRLLDYRVFADDAGRMNRSLRDNGGELLLVPQFTLVADTAKGLRPGLSRAAPPDQGRCLFATLCRKAKEQYSRVACGVFGADMQVSLTNDGPVTFWLETRSEERPIRDR
ncbi:MAG TPA: D-tyrosyl-tRNA(Tyr) deacylase [Chromatiales bacterium]|nr:D-tyrosyl-tRNA(Tyr) deacylase [Chromatiales bacterium]